MDARLASNPVERWFTARMRSAEDIVFVRNALRVWALGAIPAIGFYSGLVPLWVGIFWLPFMFAQGTGRYTLMLHALGHRPMFKRDHRWMEGLLPWFVGPFYGHTPTSFYVHHMGMHHPENNTATDLSSTIAYRRDSFAHFMHYWARFFFVGHINLIRYLRSHGRDKLVRRFLVGEISWVLVMATLLYLAPGATLLVFVVPFILLRWFMMCGNWAQHAFVDVDDPDNAYRNSICTINVPYNQTCFNDGYHIVHHIKPALHWAAMPGWYLEHLDEFGAQDAVVFTGLGDNQAVWTCLMTQNWDRLAEHLVDLPGQPQRTHDEKVAWLQQRVRTRRGTVPSVLSTAGAGPVPA